MQDDGDGADHKMIYLCFQKKKNTIFFIPYSSVADPDPHGEMWIRIKEVKSLENVPVQAH